MGKMVVFLERPVNDFFPIVPALLDIDDCASQPCVHGFCTDEFNGFKCACVAGYSGDTCDTGKYGQK